MPSGQDEEPRGRADNTLDLIGMSSQEQYPALARSGFGMRGRHPMGEGSRWRGEAPRYHGLDRRRHAASWS